MVKKESYTDNEIIAGCVNGKRHFQEILYRKYARKMYGICLGYAGQRPLAQDMLQEAFIKVFQKINQFSGTGSLEGWIRRTVTNTTIDLLGKNPSGHDMITAEMVFAPGTINENTAISQLETKDILEHIARLPEGARTIFNLYALEGMSHQEIADRLNISTGTSKSQYSRARYLLQQWVDEPN